MEKQSLLRIDSLSRLLRRLRPDNPTTELISGDGRFNEVGLSDFLNSVKFDKCDVSYAVVAIMGPQSSGMIMIDRCLISFDDLFC